MHINHVDDRELVKKSMKQLFVKAGIGEFAEPVQRDLEFLCESIEIQTGVSISLSTMKRLHNGQFSRIPQIATLNAIASFLGHRSWHEFRHQSGTAESESTENHLLKSNGRKITVKPQLSKNIWIAGGILLLLAAGLTAVFQRKSPSSDFSKARFSARKTSANEMPNTVVFEYNVDSIDADSFFIQQSWDRARRVKVFKNQYTLTDIYYEPGYHTAKLIADDKVIKTEDVSIPTDRWFFYAKEKIFKSTPKYLNPKNVSENGSLQFSSDEITKNHVDVQKEHEYIASYFPSEIKFNSDNFVMKCRIRVKQLTNNFCPTFTCEVFCQKNFMFFDAAPKGCVSEIRVQFGENYLSGKKNDFSAIGTDVAKWNDVEIRVENKKADIKMNSKLVFSTMYTIPSGLITGLAFISNGAFEVDFVDLRTLKGEKIYQNNFD